MPSPEAKALATFNASDPKHVEELASLLDVEPTLDYLDILRERPQWAHLIAPELPTAKGT